MRITIGGQDVSWKRADGKVLNVLKKIDIQRTLKKSVDITGVVFENLDPDLFPIREKELKIFDDHDRCIFGGVIKVDDPRQRDLAGETAHISVHSWETKLLNRNARGVFSGNLEDLVPQIFQDFVYDSGFTFSIDPELSVNKISLERKVLDVMEIFSQLTGAVWWITPNKEVIFTNRFNHSGIAIDDTNSQRHKQFELKVDTTQIATVILVRDVQVPTSTRVEDSIKTGDGENKVWELNYQLDNVRVFTKKDTDPDWIERTVGIDKVHGEDQYEFFYDFKQKYIRTSENTSMIEAGEKIKVDGFSYYDLFFDYKDDAAISNIIDILGAENTDGIYEFKVDPSELDHVESAEDVVEYCKELIREKGNPQITGSVIRDNSLGVIDLFDALGKTVNVTRTKQNIDNADFLVSRVRYGFNRGIWTYDFSLNSYLHGMEDILEKLLQKGGKAVKAEVVPLSSVLRDTTAAYDEITIDLIDQTEPLKFGDSFGSKSFAT